MPEKEKRLICSTFFNPKNLYFLKFWVIVKFGFAIRAKEGNFRQFKIKNEEWNTMFNPSLQKNSTHVHVKTPKHDDVNNILK